MSSEGFSAWQAAQGAKGGKAKGLANTDKRKQALDMIANGYKKTYIASVLSVHANTITNWIKKND